MDAERTRKVIEGELNGSSIDSIFEWIDLENVLGSASIAQVCAESARLSWSYGTASWLTEQKPSSCLSLM